MNAVCPNCSNEFIEQRETACHCQACGWLKQIDGKWMTCPEPAKPKDAEPPTEPKPIERTVPASPGPVPAEPDDDDAQSQTQDRPSNVRSYLGGLVTVTEIEETENNNGG